MAYWSCSRQNLFFDEPWFVFPLKHRREQDLQRIRWNFCVYAAYSTTYLWSYYFLLASLEHSCLLRLLVMCHELYLPENQLYFSFYLVYSLILIHLIFLYTRSCDLERIFEIIKEIFIDNLPLNKILASKRFPRGFTLQ